jgi:secreted Zn-dependent insulinase-like peptidase
VKPVQNVDQLQLYFPIYGVSPASDYLFKGMYFMSSMFGDEQPGSIASLLKDQGNV